MTQDEVKAAQEEDLRALEESQRAWFREHVSAALLRIPATVDLSPTQCRHHEDGTFSGGNPAGVIFRRESDADCDDARGWESDHITWVEDGLRTTVHFLNRSVIPDESLRDLLRGRFGGGDPGVTAEEPAELWRLSRQEKEELHRWSTPEVDWELTVDGLVSVGRAGMAALWDRLRPGVPVDRYSHHRPEG